MREVKVTIGKAEEEALEEWAVDLEGLVDQDHLDNRQFELAKNTMSRLIQ